MRLLLLLGLSQVNMAGKKKIGDDEKKIPSKGTKRSEAMEKNKAMKKKIEKKKDTLKVRIAGKKSESLFLQEVDFVPVTHSSSSDTMESLFNQQLNIPPPQDPLDTSSRYSSHMSVDQSNENLPQLVAVSGRIHTGSDSFVTYEATGNPTAPIIRSVSLPPVLTTQDVVPSSTSVFDRLKQSLNISAAGKNTKSSQRTPPAYPSVPTTPPSTGAKPSTPTPVTPDIKSSSLTTTKKVKVSFVKDPQQGYIRDMKRKKKIARKHVLLRQDLTPSQPTTPSSDENNSPIQQQQPPDSRHYFLRTTFNPILNSLRRKRGKTKSNGNGTTHVAQETGKNKDTPTDTSSSGATANENTAPTMSNPTGAIQSDSTHQTPSGQTNVDVNINPCNEPTKRPFQKNTEKTQRKLLVARKRDTLKDRISGKMSGSEMSNNGETNQKFQTVPSQENATPVLHPIQTSPMNVPSAPPVSSPQQQQQHQQCDSGETDNETPGHVEALQEMIDNQKNNQLQPWNLLLFTMLDDYMSGGTHSLSDSTLKTIDINEDVGFVLPCTELDLENQPPQGIIQIHPDLLEDKDYYPMMTDEEKEEYERDLKTLEKITSLKVLSEECQNKIETNIIGDVTTMDTLSDLIENCIAEMDKANAELNNLTSNELPALQARTQHRNTMLQSRIQTWLRKPLTKEEKKDAR